MDDLTESADETDTKLHETPVVVDGRNGGKLMPVRDAVGAARLHQARRDKKARAIRAGVAKAGLQAPEVGRADAYAVIEAAAENHALNSLDPSAPGSHRSLDLLLKHGWPEPERGAADSPQHTAATAFGVETARLLLSRMRELMRGDGEQGPVHE